MSYKYAFGWPSLILFYTENDCPVALVSKKPGKTGGYAAKFFFPGG